MKTPEHKNCGNCGVKMSYLNICSMADCNVDFNGWIPKPEIISFPILNSLTPTVESCTAKVLEEVGELFQLIGKGQGMSGEQMEPREKQYLAQNMIAEALDVAQSAVTMAHTIGLAHGIDLDAMMEAHEEKLRQRGYLK